MLCGCIVSNIERSIFALVALTKAVIFKSFYFSCRWRCNIFITRVGLAKSSFSPRSFMCINFPCSLAKVIRSYPDFRQYSTVVDMECSFQLRT